MTLHKKRPAPPPPMTLLSATPPDTPPLAPRSRMRSPKSRPAPPPPPPAPPTPRQDTPPGTPTRGGSGSDSERSSGVSSRGSLRSCDGGRSSSSKKKPVFEEDDDDFDQDSVYSSSNSNDDVGPDEEEEEEDNASVTRTLHSLRSLRDELTVVVETPALMAPPAEFSDSNENESSSARLGPVFTQQAWSEKEGVSVGLAGEEACRDVEEAFAGARILAASWSSPALCRMGGAGAGDGTATIRSRSGTIRGVRNRVRQGIATFLKDPNKKDWSELERGRVVVYMTTLGVIRETYARCVQVRQILRTLLIKVDERDVFMSRGVQTELMERMDANAVRLPQVFVEGQYLGDATIIENLNEIGELRKLLAKYRCPSVTSECVKCGGFRMLPCPQCRGSKKSTYRNTFTNSFVALRCSNCDDSALVRCDLCSGPNAVAVSVANGSK